MTVSNNIEIWLRTFLVILPVLYGWKYVSRVILILKMKWCGREIYSDRARSAVPLQPCVYPDTHPGYKLGSLPLPTTKNWNAKETRSSYIAEKPTPWSVTNRTSLRRSRGSENSVAWSPRTYETLTNQSQIRAWQRWRSSSVVLY